MTAVVIDTFGGVEICRRHRPRWRWQVNPRDSTWGQNRSVLGTIANTELTRPTPARRSHAPLGYDGVKAESR